MATDLSSKCRTCLSDSNIYHQLFDYVDENYKIEEMIDSIVPQIDIKNNNCQFSTLVCQCCVDKLITAFKFQQLCIETNNRLHDFLGIAIVYEIEEPKLVKIFDPLMVDSSLKIKQEIEDVTCSERERNLNELEVAIKLEDNDNDCRPTKIASDTDSCNEKLSFLKIRSTKNPLKVTTIEEVNGNKRNKVQFPCLECGRVFDRLYNLQRHVQVVHFKKLSFSCDICNHSFTEKKAFNTHMLKHVKGDFSNKEDNDKYHNNEIECKEINENTECNQSKLKSDNKEKEECKELKVVLPFQCPDCPKSFEKKISLSAHHKIHKKKDSNKCNKDKKTEGALEYDGVVINSNKEANVVSEMIMVPKVIVKEEIEDTSQIFQEFIDDLDNNAECFKNENVDSDDKSDKGLLAKSGAKQTENTVLIDSKIGEIVKPNRSNKNCGNFTCELCGKVFNRSFGLKRHRLKCHSLNRHYKCEICKHRFTAINILKAHMTQHGNDGSGKRGNFPCDVCGKVFNRKFCFKRHRIKCDVKKHKCDQCDKTFLLYTHLVKHLKQHVKRCVCHICEKKFIYSKSLKYHMHMHSREKCYLCPQCGKTFGSASTLSEHKKRHTDSKNYQCSQCLNRFKLKADLTKHISTHTNAKPHVCDICGSRFTRASSLRKHKLLHSGKRPFKCDQCSMTFVIGYTLQRHMLTHTGEKPYKCKYCDRAYAASGDLNKHLRTHVGKNTYICDQCPMAFKYHAELKQHQFEHYKMAQKLLQQGQKMSEEAQDHEIKEQSLPQQLA